MLHTDGTVPEFYSHFTGGKDADSARTKTKTTIIIEHQQGQTGSFFGCFQSSNLPKQKRSALIEHPDGFTFQRVFNLKLTHQAKALSQPLIVLPLLSLQPISKFM